MIFRFIAVLLIQAFLLMDFLPCRPLGISQKFQGPNPGKASIFTGQAGAWTGEERNGNDFLTNCLAPEVTIGANYFRQNYLNFYKDTIDIAPANFVRAKSRIEDFGYISKPLLNKNGRPARTPIEERNLPRGMTSDAYAYYMKVGLEGWENKRMSTYAFSNPAFQKLMLKNIGRGKKILSLGCGSAELDVKIQDAGNVVVGIDAVPEMVEAAKKNGLKNVLLADAHNLPAELKKGEFDIVFFPESLGNMIVSQVLKEAWTALKPGGKIMITTYPPPKDVPKAKHLYRKTTKEKLEKIINKAGFKIFKSEESFWPTYHITITLPGHLIYLEAQKDVSNKIRKTNASFLISRESSLTDIENILEQAI